LWRSCKTFLQGKAEIVETRSPRLFRRWEAFTELSRITVFEFEEKKNEQSSLIMGALYKQGVLDGICLSRQLGKAVGAIGL
jgi:hypothetical protein